MIFSTILQVIIGKNYYGNLGKNRAKIYYKNVDENLGKNFHGNLAKNPVENYYGNPELIRIP